MDQTAQGTPALRATEDGSRARSRVTAVGASYSFDPAADGLAGIYARRILERGGDPRALCAEARADLLGTADRGQARRALLARSRTSRFGRGTATHLYATGNGPLTPARAAAPMRAGRSASPARTERPRASRMTRRLAAAGLAVLLLLPIGALVASAQEGPAQARYVVQSGDTLETVAVEFGVDPAAILAASTLQNPPELTAAETIVIPAPGESPEDAAWNAAQREGSSPFVAGAHIVADGETLADIAAVHGLDPWALATFNGISDIDLLSAGQRLLIPLTEGATVQTEQPAADAVSPESAWSMEPGLIAETLDESVAWEEPASGPVIAADVPAYFQAYSLSCEYAAAYIATAGFGWGIPESAFVERIGTSLNPHWGYRGSIHGAWGGTDDYGVYPEALVPTLNEFGFMGDVFYGGDASSLTARLDSGMPVLTWLGYFGDTAWLQEDEGAYLLAPGLHVVTVYGYDDGGVYVSNPGRGSYDYYTWGDFLAMWSVLNGMALGIAPM